jgi:hypothetical protein
MSIFLFSVALFAGSTSVNADTTQTYTLENEHLNVKIGENGEISSLKIVDDLYDTEYVMNKDVAPDMNTKETQWLGELMFSYQLEGETDGNLEGKDGKKWKKAWTTLSDDVRKITEDGNQIKVEYANSESENGIKNFSLKETYTLEKEDLVWTTTLKNTSDKKMTIADWGVPVPFNELWKYGGEIYEERVVSHSYVGGDTSYLTAQRPSGQGPYIMMSSDNKTNSGFEYQDRWRTQEVGDTTWAWNNTNEGNWIEGLNVFYIHSEHIQKSNRGYLKNTSLVLAPGEEKTYTYRIAKVDDEKDSKEELYENGLVDVTVTPGMIVPINQPAKIALRSKNKIKSVEATSNNDMKIKGKVKPPKVKKIGKNGDYFIYEVTFKKEHLGTNNIVVNYGKDSKMTLQFYAIDEIASLLNTHSDFMVEKTQWDEEDGIDKNNVRYKVFDDWMMNAKTGEAPVLGKSDPKGKRNEFKGYWGWGDDWGLPHGEYLAEKNVYLPVKKEVQAVDDYLKFAIWETLMDGHHEDYLIHDFLQEEGDNSTPTYRGYAYTHVYNTFFSMYQIAKQNPDLIDYHFDRKWYLETTYNIFKAMYDGPVSYNWATGTMGELTTPQIIQALRDEGMEKEASDLETKMEKKFENFSSNKYPYGSEYSYDNTGEESVYTLARLNLKDDKENALRMMKGINQKTRASRGHMPVWYYYANPVTITGENWWNFQYTVSLAAYPMDDWIRNYADDYGESDQYRAEQQRLSYASKIAALASVNSGQINNHPDNIGAAAWTYQAEKGNLGTAGVGGGENVELLNGWRGMTGEADLGLFGALKILSADVVKDDPIFGLLGYGAEVNYNKKKGIYQITPTDGLHRRVNLITEQLSIVLNNDQYTKAELSDAKDSIKLDMKNNTNAPHKSSIDVTGMKHGTYQVEIKNKKTGKTEKQGKINVYSENINVPYEVKDGNDYVLMLKAAEPDENKAPEVHAGNDQEGEFKLDSINLAGSVKDDNLGNPNGYLSVVWEVERKPEGAKATFTKPDSLRTGFEADVPGEYVVKLTASDGELSAADTVKVTIKAQTPTPEKWVNYSFDQVDGNIVTDEFGNENHLELYGTAKIGPGRKGNSLQLDGKDGSYGQLPNDILSRAKETTISTWMKLDEVTTFTRIFDFGNGIQKYMFLTPKDLNNGTLSLAITTGGNNGGAEEWIETDYKVSPNEWTHVAVTFKDNVGTIYVNGEQVGQNENLTLSPSDLGRTASNYIGKSQYADPYFKGAIDDFQIYGRALSQEEIKEQTKLNVEEIDSVESAVVDTMATVKPTLPNTLKVTMKDGTIVESPVNWDNISEDNYQEIGAFEVSGVLSGTDFKVTAKVNVVKYVPKQYPELLTRYEFEDNTNSMIEDISGNGYNANIVGNLNLLPGAGHHNNGIQLSNQSGNYLDLGKSRELIPESITFSYWVKRTEDLSKQEHVLAWFKEEGNYASNGFFITYNGNSSIIMVDGTNNFHVPQNPNEFLPLNEWTHVVFTFDAKTKDAAIYKNGEKQKVAYQGSINSITTNDAVKRIGVSGYGNAAPFNSPVDDIRIYSNAMNEKEVKELYDGKDIIELENVTVETTINQAPTLPELINVSYESGVQGTAIVVWDEIDPINLSKEGSFQVEGVVEGTRKKAMATVRVVSGN